MIWTIKKKVYRTGHHMMNFLLPVIKLPEPEVISGSGSISRVPDIIKKEGIENILLVTDKVLMNLGLLDTFIRSLEERKISYQLFDGVQPNPTIQNVEDGVRKYISSNCKGIVTIGGGSPMDCAKVIGARIANPKKSVKKMKGKFKVRNKLPLLVMIPTTAGTGSETTVVAVVSDPENHEKFAVASTKLVPDYAILDPDLMLGLPPAITSTTGMDALTHAVEAYINVIGTPFTDEKCEKAVKLIFENLESAYQDGSDCERRNNLAIASYYAGVAFTRAMVGYAHAIAHNLGGLYNTPHGLANAVLLPHILEFSRKDAEEKLASLAVAAGIGKKNEPNEALSIKFIEKVKNMNRTMNIPDTFEELREKDIPVIAERAIKEGNPDYPVPTIMNKNECETILRRLIRPV